ncbi:hypothetical protein LSH36_27g06046 [Paralvinella palmiformis]|uniref:Sorbitol dehydrogenase n=1 Tax=Paralvinella palmiformis TaxID=53620 RepID=A0AAD9KAG4_9ANNE|nr:hypothetical protein LSH36_27g06046 [Paralvinella palmiformis]
MQHSANFTVEMTSSLEERPIPEPGPGEVQVAIQSVGICGSDVHYWTNGSIGDFILRSPMVLGHESSGIISKLGPGVKHLAIGDRVALEPGVPCRMCEFCKKGRYNLCPEIQFLATPPVHGDLSRYHVHAADFCYKLPDHMSLDEGALLEPLAVGVHACTRGGITIGDKVLVCGAGPIGLVCMMTAKAMGADEVIVTDISDTRLAVAKSMGATHTLKVSGEPNDVARVVRSVLGSPPRVSVECSGAESSVKTAIYATKSGGMVLLVGMGAPEVQIPLPAHILAREVDIRGIFRYANSYPIALDMVASGRVDVKPLITHHFTLEETLQAFKTSKTGEGGAIKVMIHCLKK